MLAVISKWGNSQGIRLNKTILEAAKLNVNDPVEISTIGNKIVITRSNKVSMKSLFQDYKEDEYIPSEVDWGEAKGKEIW